MLPVSIQPYAIEMHNSHWKLEPHFTYHCLLSAGGPHNLSASWWASLWKIYWWGADIISCQEESTSFISLGGETTCFAHISFQGHFVLSLYRRARRTNTKYVNMYYGLYCTEARHDNYTYCIDVLVSGSHAYSWILWELFWTKAHRMILVIFGWKQPSKGRGRVTFVAWNVICNYLSTMWFAACKGLGLGGNESVNPSTPPPPVFNWYQSLCRVA